MYVLEYVSDMYAFKLNSFNISWYQLLLLGIELAISCKIIIVAGSNPTIVDASDCVKKCQIYL